MESRNSISMLLEQTANAFGTRASKQLQPYGITYTQTLVLCLLVNTFGGSCLQSELRKEMGVSGPALSGILKRLEKYGFVVKADDSMDTRKNRVSASEKTFDKGLTGVSAPISKIRIPEHEADSYFNSGVLLMNLKKIRQEVNDEAHQGTQSGCKYRCH